MPFDVIIIGSGFGGAVSACRLAQANLKVLVLERGRWWNPSTFPRAAEDPWVWNHEDPVSQNGWLDLRMFRGMSVAQGAGVGGGSLIYANISCEAPAAAFDQGWPAEITYADLKPRYDRVADFMDVQTVPDNQWTARMKLMSDAATAAGYGDRFRKLPLAVTFDPNWTYADHDKKADGSVRFTNKHGAPQGTCVHLGNCDIGCDVAARNTLDLNYLHIAQKKSAEIRHLHLVDVIEQLPDGTYRVGFDDIRNGQRVAGTETAKQVIIAAGSLGSTELLLRNRDIHRTLPNVSQFLGRNWSSNGDFLTPAFYPNRKPEPSWGPTITSAIDFLDGSQEGRRFWIEDGGFPDLLVGYLFRKSTDPGASFKTKAFLNLLRQFCRSEDAFRNVMPWFAQGVDAGNGVLRLSQPTPFSRGGSLQLDWDITESQPLIDAIVAMHKELAAKTGGIAMVPPTWSLFKDLVTPHPLGGCNMGDTPANGVVNHRGQVFNYPNLFVVDGAIIPRPLGVNPSRTIAALAERICDLIVAGAG